MSHILLGIIIYTPGPDERLGLPSRSEHTFGNGRNKHPAPAGCDGGKSQLPCYNLRRFSSPKTLQSVAPDVLVAFLEPHRDFIAAKGYDLPASGATISDFDRLTLTAILMNANESTPADLVDALYYTHETGHDRNIDTLVDLAQGMGLDIPALSTPMDIAMRVWTADKTALVKKHAQLHISRPHAFEHYQADEPMELVEPTTEQLEALQTRLDEWFTAHKRGGSSKVFVYPDHDQMWFLIRHGDPYRRESAMDGYKSKGILYRPETFDVGCYDASIGELRVYTRNKGERELYRREFGRLVAGDISHFPSDDKYTLDPIKYDGDRCVMTRDIDGIDWVMLTEIRFQTNATFFKYGFSFSCSNVFAALKHREITIERGDKIVRAKFLVKFTDDPKARPATIATPNKLLVSRDSDAELLVAWLTARGFIRGSQNGGMQNGCEESQAFLAGL